jgi:hypothetical protein
MNLLLAGKALVVEESGKFIRTVRDKFSAPSVIALKVYINVPRRKASWSRKGVLVRDDYSCIYGSSRPGAWVIGKVLNKGDVSVDQVIA